MVSHTIYEQGLEQVPANFEALSPLTFLERAASVYPYKTAVVYNDVRRNWQDTYTRCRRLASALQRRGVKKGETVSIICPNIPEHFEAHFAIPMKA